MQPINMEIETLRERLADLEILILILQSENLTLKRQLQENQVKKEEGE